MSHVDVRRTARDERGAILLWVAVAAVVLVGFAALALDMGYAYATKRTLSNAADAAALAGAQEAGTKFLENGGCTTALKTIAKNKVEDYHEANNVDGSFEVSVDCDVDGLTATSIDVTVTEKRDTPAFFGRVLGVDALRPAAVATAQVIGTKNPGGLRPFVVCLDDALDAEDAPSTTLQSVFLRANADVPGSSCNPTGLGGNWGLSRFDITTPDNNTLGCLVQNGYGAPGCEGEPPLGVNVGQKVDPTVQTCPPACGDNGNNWSNADNDKLDALVGTQFLVPVGQSWVDEKAGSNATYTGRGAIAVTLCGYVDPKGKRSNPATPEIDATGCWDPGLYKSVPGETLKVATLVIQWKYADEWIQTTVGQPSSSGDRCSMGDFTCPRSLALIK
jgi:hypothetical protein